MRSGMWQVALAGAGVVILVVVAAIAATAIGSARFRDAFTASASEVLSDSLPVQGVVTEADLADLPQPVQRYLRYTGVVGTQRTSTVRLKQAGALRQTQEDSWKDIEAVEYFSVDPAAFVWMGEMAAGPFSIVAARDSYVEGRGHMLIKMLGIRTIGDVRGDEMDYSSLVRYLNEMMWFPTAFLEDNILWEAIDHSSARVTITDGDLSASAVMRFDEEGALTTFTGERYHEVDGEYVKDTWETPMTRYGEFNGLRLPVEGEAVWRMSSGDFSYIRLEITALEYNATGVYS